ncbi:anti-sigma factor [Rossellomorea marisflavi]|uniref:anti-sigma factor n=1 Tax=Rossellomorea marisflavi TaxID=189381 RepID=UPI0028537221|nr:anti-sigma factor [Rossellomorea marisflavi]MDR4938550.1 anti-sigma factor [Rossellomorea marisflavi]
MTQHQCDHILDYYNGHLSELEKAAFEKHLASCSECQEFLNELEQISGYLPYSSEPVEPPTDLEDRVFARILNDSEEKQRPVTTPRQKRRRPWIFPSIAAALALSIIGNAYLFTQLEDQKRVVEEATIDEVIEYAELAPVSGQGTGTASIIKQGKQTSMVVQASDLAKLSDKEVYQVWLIKDEKPERAGTFVTSGDGKGSVIFKFNEEFTEKDWDQVAVSLEPDANSELPQGEIVLAADI